MAVTRRDMSNEYLYIGDQIYLSEEASGYLASQGFSNVAVGMSLARDSVPRECVFQVRQQHNYTVAKQMRAALERARSQDPLEPPPACPGTGGVSPRMGPPKGASAYRL